MKSLNTKELSEFLSKTFVFTDVSTTELTNALDQVNPEIKRFTQGTVIYSPGRFENKVGFIYDGECQVERVKANNSNLPLNKLEKYNSFGILAVFSCDNSYPTQVIAKKDSTVVFISKSDILILIKKHPQISLNLLNFISDLIEFLNKKISTFSSDTVEEKVASFLWNIYTNQNCRELSLNMSKIATSINVGRASLYRAIDSLSESKIIEFKNKKIIILDPEGLERITK